MAATVANRAWVFKQPPTELLEPGVTTAIEDHPLQLVPTPGGVVVKLLVAGVDPHQRDRMRGPGLVDYVPGYANEEVITNFSLGVVIESDNAEFPKDSLIAGSLPISEYSLIPKELIDARPAASPLVWRVTNEHGLDLKHFVGTLGLAGMTAWNSFYGLVKPVKGETIWVNAATSSVGELVVQLAKREGMRVIASVSSDDKLDYVVKELGADSAFNYKKEPVQDALKRLAPEGLDVVFENVGGDHLQAAIENMKWFGRIIVCGAASQYNKPINEQYGITNLSEVFRRRILIQGFCWWDDNVYTANIDNFWASMPKWISEGQIKSRYTEFEGIAQSDAAFLSMFTGGSFGKTYVKISDL